MGSLLQWDKDALEFRDIVPLEGVGEEGHVGAGGQGREVANWQIGRCARQTSRIDGFDGGAREGARVGWQWLLQGIGWLAVVARVVGVGTGSWSGLVVKACRGGGASRRFTAPKGWLVRLVEACIGGAVEDRQTAGVQALGGGNEVAKEVRRKRGRARGPWAVDIAHDGTGSNG